MSSLVTREFLDFLIRLMGLFGMLDQIQFLKKGNRHEMMGHSESSALNVGAEVIKSTGLPL